MTPRFVPAPPYAESVVFENHGTCAPRIIVLHDTEGGSPRSVVSTLKTRRYGVHWIIGQNAATIRGNNSTDALWHVGDYNSEAVGIEQCGFASFTHSRWMQNPWQLLECAWIVAWEAQRHGIPLELVTPSAPGDGTTGVTTHSRLGTAGGGHHDPGVGYPLSHVLGMAASIQARGLGRVERATVAARAHFGSLTR